MNPSTPLREKKKTNDSRPDRRSPETDKEVDGGASKEIDQLSKQVGKDSCTIKS